MASGTREYITCDDDVIIINHHSSSVRHLALQPPEVQLRDGDVGVEVGHPARELAANLAIIIEEFLTDHQIIIK